MTMTAEQLEELLGEVVQVKAAETYDEIMKAFPGPPIVEYLCRENASLARRVIAAEALRDALKGMIKAYREPDKQLCCNGYMCGCRGASERDYADYWAAEAIKAWEDAE